MKSLMFFIAIMGFTSLILAEGKSEEVKAKEKVDFSIRGELPDWHDTYTEEDVERAVFAGGCFWGVEAVYEQLQGVIDVDSGYSGGSAETAFYKQVGTGHTGHAEAVEIIYDPELISYETLLDVFFTVAHDPTQYNYQGPDVGTEYRSAIFYTDESQQKKAHTMIQKLTEEKVYTNPIVTELVPLDSFYPAEDYHQDFLRLNPTHGYIAYWDIPKLEHLWEEYPELVYE